MRFGTRKTTFLKFVNQCKPLLNKVLSYILPQLLTTHKLIYSIVNPSQTLAISGFASNLCVCRLTPYPAFLHLLSFSVILLVFILWLLRGSKATKGVLGEAPNKRINNERFER